MSNQYPPGGYNPPPGGAPPGGGGYNPPPPGGMPPGGMPPGGMPPGGMPPGGGGYGAPPGAPPAGGGYGPPPGGPPGGMPPPAGGAVMAAPPGASPEPKKGGCGGKGIIILGILGVLFVLFLCAGGAAAAWYFDALGALFGGGSSVAYKHLPEGCEVVAHIDLKGVMETPAVKKHVVPALDEAQKNPDSDKFAAFFRSAQLNPKKDLHSVAICMTNLRNSDPDFLVIVGGNIRAGKVIDAFDKHSDKDKFEEAKTIAGMKVVEAKDEPVMIAQADDGAIVLTNQQGLLKKAAKSGSAWKKYGLPMSEQMSVVLTKEAAQAMNDKAGPRNPLGNAAANIGRGQASLSLNTGKIALELEMGSESDAKEAADAINELLKLANSGPAMAGDEKDLVQSIEIKADGKAVTGSATIPEKMIEDAAKEFAEDVQEAGDEI